MKNRIIVLTLSGIFLFNPRIFSQSFTPEEILKQPSKGTVAQDIIDISQNFLGTPYLAGTLEGPEEKLVCKLDGFDCYTLVENVLALALTKKSGQKTEENYMKMLQKLRYRNGKIDGYTSRIHYFFEWAKQAERYGYLQDLSPIFGVKLNKKIDFMSQNSKLYPALSSAENILKLTVVEQNISKIPFYYVPKDNFSNYVSLIKDGDIVAFTSTVAGLDVNHEGFAVWQNGKLKLLHASLEKKKVIISEETLNQYLQRVKKHSGVLILRPKN
ncbi:MAG: DUF1460 domain-containing protein [Cytophagaceae bacterium]|nr:DUF1460 domain-containing protein [Cytophagaceae bacterium]